MIRCLACPTWSTYAPKAVTCFTHNEPDPSSNDSSPVSKIWQQERHGTSIYYMCSACPVFPIRSICQYGQYDHYVITMFNMFSTINPFRMFHMFDMFNTSHVLIVFNAYAQCVQNVPYLVCSICSTRSGCSGCSTCPTLCVRYVHLDLHLGVSDRTVHYFNYFTSQLPNVAGS